MLQISCSTTGDDRNAYGLRNGSGEFDVVAILRAVRVHTGEQNFASSTFVNFLGPGDGIEAHGGATAVRINAPFSGAFALGINGNHNALAAESFGSSIDEGWFFDRRGIDTDFICSSKQHETHILNGANTATDGEGNETMLGGATHHIGHGGTVI